jgi:hypothetical protein
MQNRIKFHACLSWRNDMDHNLLLVFSQICSLTLASGGKQFTWSDVSNFYVNVQNLTLGFFSVSFYIYTFLRHQVGTELHYTCGITITLKTLLYKNLPHKLPVKIGRMITYKNHKDQNVRLNMPAKRPLMSCSVYPCEFTEWVMSPMKVSISLFSPALILYRKFVGSFCLTHNIQKLWVYWFGMKFGIWG